MSVLDPELSDEPREQAFAAVYRADQMHETDAPGLSGRAERVALGTLAPLDELDADINAVSDPQTPAAVILSEAVRIAKEYSTQASGRFVNGVLATLAARLRD